MSPATPDPGPQRRHSSADRYDQIEAVLDLLGDIRSATEALETLLQDGRQGAT